MIDQDQRIYVELDCLLDTRIATLAKINPEHAVKAVGDKRYYDRMIDDFTDICGVGVAEFKEAYAKRDVSTLQISLLTQVPLMLSDLVKKLEAESVETPFTRDVEVEVNYWPYELTAEEIDGLQLSVMFFSGIQTKVHFVSIPMDKLKLRYMKARYTGAFIYHLTEFLEARGAELTEVMMPDFPVIAPALWKEKVPDPTEIYSEGIPTDIIPFRFVEMSLTSFFQLSLVPAKYFSILEPSLLASKKQKRHTGEA